MNKPAINEHSEVYRLAKQLHSDLDKAANVNGGDLTAIEEQAEVLVQEIMDMVPTDILELDQRTIDTISANLDQIYEAAAHMQFTAENILENIDKIRDLLNL